MLGKYLLVWLPMIPLAIANGTLRELTYGRHVSELRAHQISTVTALVLFAAYLGFAFRAWPLNSAAHAWAVGLMFLVLTVAFEFGFGHWVAGHSWSRLLHDYNLPAGRVWSLVLLWITIAPYVFFRMRK